MQKQQRKKSFWALRILPEPSQPNIPSRTPGGVNSEAFPPCQELTGRDRNPDYSQAIPQTLLILALAKCLEAAGEEL